MFFKNTSGLKKNAFVKKLKACLIVILGNVFNISNI